MKTKENFPIYKRVFFVLLYITSSIVLWNLLVLYKTEVVQYESQAEKLESLGYNCQWDDENEEWVCK